MRGAPAPTLAPRGMERPHARHETRPRPDRKVGAGSHNLSPTSTNITHRLAHQIISIVSNGVAPSLRGTPEAASKESRAVDSWMSSICLTLCAITDQRKSPCGASPPPENQNMRRGLTLHRHRLASSHRCRNHLCKPAHQRVWDPLGRQRWGRNMRLSGPAPARAHACEPERCL